MKRTGANLENEAALTEISIAPDGRILVFGMSKQVLDVLGTLDFEDDDLKRRIDFVRSIGGEQPHVDGGDQEAVQHAGETVTRRKETNHE